MIRLLVAIGLLFAGLTPLAPAAADPIDQAGWNDRKRLVELPNGIRLAYVELGDPHGPPLPCFTAAPIPAGCGRSWRPGSRTIGS